LASLILLEQCENDSAKTDNYSKFAHNVTPFSSSDSLGKQKLKSRAMNIFTDLIKQRVTTESTDLFLYLHLYRLTFYVQ